MIFLIFLGAYSVWTLPAHPMNVLILLVYVAPIYPLHTSIHFLDIHAKRPHWPIHRGEGGSRGSGNKFKSSKLQIVKKNHHISIVHDCRFMIMISALLGSMGPMEILQEERSIKNVYLRTYSNFCILIQLFFFIKKL